MEGLVNYRLLHKIRGQFHENLIGFLHDRGTEDGLMALSNHISRYLYREFTTTIGKSKSGDDRRKNWKTAVAFIDFSKAFELADQRYILHTLESTAKC